MKNKAIQQGAFLFILAFILYGNTLYHNYALDDYIAITGNEFTKKGVTGIKELMTHDAFVGTYGEALELTGGRYRPLSMVFFAIEYELFGLNPHIGHFGNVLLFAISCVLIYCLLGRISPTEADGLFPFTAALLFAVHPIHTEVVANIKSRDEILVLLLLTTAVIISLKSKSHHKYFLAPVIFFLALLSKENAITFLAVIPLALYCFTNKKTTEIMKQMLPLLLVTAVYLWMRAEFAGMVGDRTTADIMDDPYLHAALYEKYATVTYTMGKYLWLMFLPHPLSSDYSFNEVPLVNWLNLKVMVSLMIFLSLGIYSILKIKKHSLIAFGIIFSFITFSIVSNAFFNVGTSMAERFIYLPSLGFCIAMAAILLKLYKMILSKGKSKLYWAVPLSLIVVLSSAKTIARNRVWSDNFTLYETDVKNAPNSARIHLYYGIELLGKFNETNDKALLTKAVSEIKKATVINPEFHHAFYNLGVAQEKAGDIEAAIASYKKVLTLQPKHIKSILNLGLVYGKIKNDLDSSIFYFGKLLNSNYKEEYLFDNLGIAYAMKGDLENARTIFAEGIKYNPQSAKLNLNLAITYDNLGDKKSAEKFYQKAFSLDPSLKK